MVSAREATRQGIAANFGRNSRWLRSIFGAGARVRNRREQWWTRRPGRANAKRRRLAHAFTEGPERLLTGDVASSSLLPAAPERELPEHVPDLEVTGREG